MRKLTFGALISRLHKPVRIIQGSERAAPMVEGNLISAVRASLLLLPERFSAQEFYRTVAGLSYTGAPKSGLCEVVHSLSSFFSASSATSQLAIKPFSAFMFFTEEPVEGHSSRNARIHKNERVLDFSSASAMVHVSLLGYLISVKRCRCTPIHDVLQVIFACTSARTQTR